MRPMILLFLMLLSACTLKPASSVAEVELTVVVNTPEPATETSMPQPEAVFTTIALTGSHQPSPTSYTHTPSPTIQANNNCTARTDMTTYTVVVGDSLSSIAIRTGSTVSQLVEWNCLENANMIVVGMRLQVFRQAIPPTATYTPTPTNTLTPTPTLVINPPLVSAPMGVLGADPATQNAPNWSEYLVIRGTAVTIMWTGIDPQYYAHVGQIQFFYTADGSSPVSIGIDSDKSDGISITWLLPDSISGSITARAQYGTNGTIESPAIYLRPQ